MLCDPEEIGAKNNVGTGHLHRPSRLHKTDRPAVLSSNSLKQELRDCRHHARRFVGGFFSCQHLDWLSVSFLLFYCRGPA